MNQRHRGIRLQTAGIVAEAVGEHAENVGIDLDTRDVTLAENERRQDIPAAADANQSGGLTYNVRVGTGTNAINILSPMAAPVSGARLLPAPAVRRLSISKTISRAVFGRHRIS